MNKLIKSILALHLILILLAAFMTGCQKKEVYPAQQLPQINNVFPSSGKAGTTIQIKGVNLKNVTAVKFGTKDAAGFTASANTDTAISVVVPDSMALGATYVQVYLNNGAGYSAYKFTVLLTPPVPKVYSVNPTTALPGDVITITGNNFSQVTNVKFSGIDAAFSPTADTNGRMTVTVPWNAIGGNQYIAVINPNGYDSIAFNVNLRPVVTSFSPATVNVGDLVTVKGLRFTGADTVLLGTLATTFTVIDDTTLSFTVPTGALTGNVTVTTPKGTGVSAGSVVVNVPGFKLIIYDDAIVGGFSKWGGWGGTADENNTAAPVESGAKSVKISYVGGWGSPLQLGGASIDISAYSTFKLSLYGSTGCVAGSNKVKIVFNGAGGVELLVPQGVWTDFQIPLNTLITSGPLTEIWIQEFNGVDKTVYMDNMGLN